MAIIIVVIGTVLVNIPYFIKAESEDEMSMYNRKRAEARVYKLLALVILICSIVAFIRGAWIINLRATLPFLLGGVYLMESIFFIVYDKVGD